MFRSTGLINLRSILADRIARGLVAIFAVTLLQGIFTGPEVVFADESPAIEISAPTITTTFGQEASGVISAVGGTPGYTFGYTGSVPGVSFAYIDSTSVGVQVAANAPPGTYRKVIKGAFRRYCHIAQQVLGFAHSKFVRGRTKKIERAYMKSRKSKLFGGIAIAASIALTATGCSSDEGSNASGQVEVFSWWTGGGEEAGLNALVEVFNQEYPDVEFVNAAVAGGAGTNARAVLATRLQAGEAPDSFQGHAGAELMDYITAGQLEDLSFLYDEEGWRDVMPATLLPLITVDGKIYSVPVNIHRANVMWANPKVLADNGITMPGSWDEFFAAADKLKAAGVTPLALGEQWTQLHLFETVLLGVLGTDAYNGLWDGSTGWDSAEVKGALDTFKKVLTYTNSDAASLSWQDASKLVIDGKAAFNIMGDWAEGYFRVDNSLVEQEGYTWAPAPGTAGTFQFLSDSFTLPVGAKNRDAAIAWLKVAGSAAGQDAFNVKKGSIPARSDADKAIYPPYLQSAMDDWGSNEIAGSLTHGVTASNAWKAEIDTALGLFLQNKDVAKFQAALATAATNAGK